MDISTDELDYLATKDLKDLPKIPQEILSFCDTLKGLVSLKYKDI